MGLQYMRHILGINFEDDDSVIRGIQTASESALYDGVNANNELMIASVERDRAIRITTYQHNDWVRVNDYDLHKNEFGEIELIRSEFYKHNTYL